MKIHLVETVLSGSVGLCSGLPLLTSLLESPCQHPPGSTQSLYAMPVPAKIYITPDKTILQSVLDLNGWKHSSKAKALSTLGRFLVSVPITALKIYIKGFKVKNDKFMESPLCWDCRGMRPMPQPFIPKNDNKLKKENPMLSLWYLSFGYPTRGQKIPTQHQVKTWRLLTSFVPDADGTLPPLCLCLHRQRAACSLGFRALSCKHTLALLPYTRLSQFSCFQLVLTTFEASSYTTRLMDFIMCSSIFFHNHPDWFT